MEKLSACNAFQIGVNQWMRDRPFFRLMEIMKKYKGAADELIFSTSGLREPQALPEVREGSLILAERIRAAKSEGFGAGVSVPATMGHHEENTGYSLNIPATRATGLDGRICRGSFCLNDTMFLDYVAGLYTIIAGTSPDFIYIGDDVRLHGHMPVSFTCFCDKCVEMFETETGLFSQNGMLPSRANIRALFDSPDAALRRTARGSWLSHNRTSIARLLTLIERIVHSAKPGIVLGLMTGERFYEGYDFDNWAKTLKGSGASVMWGPGGGFGMDETPDKAFEKANQIGRQCAYLPDFVGKSSPELKIFHIVRSAKASESQCMRRLFTWRRVVPARFSMCR